ncbi:MAG TPA: thioredoxin family protein [Ktedonobacteraceae bacterium]|jgi:thiol:disulfide interchange protein|nr:thioredoxin family protein [Ktedonobacteraceae bacterium]
MPELIVRLLALILVGLFTWMLVWGGRSFVERRRKLAMSAAPLADGKSDTSRVRILAFSSEDCVQCHRFQAPALQRVAEARGGQVQIEEIDAPNSPALTKRYQVLTVPTTVVLDTTGHVQAVNYGFANAQRLLEQVDAALSAA